MLTLEASRAAGTSEQWKRGLLRYGICIAVAVTVTLGVGCAGLEPTSAPTLDPTNIIIPARTSTPSVSCTPPACRLDEGEVYHCDGTCPRGCGTSCATVTPSATPPAIPPTNAVKVPIPTSGFPSQPLTTLTESEIAGLINPGIKAAFEDLARRVDSDTSPAEILRADQATWPDSSLGCP